MRSRAGLWMANNGVLRSETRGSATFPICVTVLITDSDAGVARSQFILVNSTKPIPAGTDPRTLADDYRRITDRAQLRRFPLTCLTDDPRPITNSEGVYLYSN